jgi:hypothetical protein
MPARALAPLDVPTMTSPSSVIFSNHPREPRYVGKYVFSLTSLIKQPANLSIKVDVSREFTRNEQLDHASDVKNRELGSLSVDAC